ncbi:hypothetical protein [Chryseobacterium taichungense]|uniref:hypothetical protein n=1 Tax=Chryseobacterium taichungense TaxID=295069 RepID=UPI0028AF5928|nr:hypothetical protein [Chryseobacterium taichungense]
MKRLEEIKNEYAKELELSNWDDMIEYFLTGDINGIFYAYENIIIRYASECVKASLEKASEVAYCDDDLNDKDESEIMVVKESITNPENIVLL